MTEDTLVDTLIPSDFFLSQNYPNPFSDKTTIKFCVAVKSRIRLDVVDPQGTLIELLVDEEKGAGTYEVEFSASASHSGERRSLSEGVYLYRLHAGSLLLTKKMNLLGQTLSSTAATNHKVSFTE